MKKIITILLFVAIIPTMVFANFMNLSVGTNYSSTESYNSEDLNLSNIYMGPEVRANLSFIEVGLKSKYFSQIGNSNKLAISGDVNFLIDLSFLQLGLGISTDSYDISFNDDGSTTNLSGNDMEDWFMNSNLNWRLSAGLTLGHLRFVGDYIVPTNFQFNAEDTSTIIPDSWENGYVSISFLYSLFR
ncbi:MAG: hypothetical protein WC162_03100 [Sphaerochaetaceae bacterium]